MKPPPDTKCDGSTGWGTDHLGQPVVHRCQNPATETCHYANASSGFFAEVEIWLCKECADSMREAGTVT